MSQLSPLDTMIGAQHVVLSKSEICDMISEHDTLKSIFTIYKESNKTDGHTIYINNEYKNGLCEKGYVISNKFNGDILSIIIPVFSSENTITWDIRYINDIKKSIPSELKQILNLEDHEITNLIYCPLFKYDKTNNDLLYMQTVKLTDWLDNGFKGKNGYSVYFVNDRLPNKLDLRSKAFRSDLFIKLLPSMTKKELKTVCTEYALKYHSKFANVGKRSEQTVIKNIADGLYAQIQVYLWLKREGYKVELEWSNSDDLGIDITYIVNGANINIDVKSTKTTDLKISKNRKETDFYAVCTWNKTEPQLLGFLFKFNFWQSDIINSKSPEKKGDMYHKSLNDIYKDLVSIDDLYNVHTNYQRLKSKYNSRLFNAE